ncbi:putative early meiotic induction protein 1 [Rosellinia necatrix]|uniref:Putative early meiotic induction protein 1 n=1 Tax=Rosellinia necatrix TaxID=77044 RepID=A0A1W2TNZ1_ROSNE|nr:putative early meiotic induction protein 1 [Rosellinia necatrix]
MGWLWSSGPQPKGSAQGMSNSDPESRPAPSRAPESMYSDPEVAKFMAQVQLEFGSDSGGSSSRSNKSAPPAPTPKTDADPIPSSQTAPSSLSSSSSSSSWWPSWGASPAATERTHPTAAPTQAPWPSPSAEGELPERLDPLSEALLPTTMSCRQAFDHAFHCNSVGGQWTAVYRAGTMRSCSEQWADFWFCMRTRTQPPGPARDEAVRAHYRRKELAKYGPGMPSSTDVWEPRAEPLAPDAAAFRARPYRKPDIDDEEWRRQEIEYRVLVRRMLQEEEEEGRGRST